ncbi:hypothetical protein NSQ91_28735 [Paenibacillus sp. FSL R7-0048]|jgi:hypothetical protein|uniref:YqbQ/XkdQ domain-containing protein n=1 Tax=Paenibacillus odorifer TaxID=189426 RepID=A0ABX3GF00_9BACL|nr:hypothetical protein [Paenibacillus odorifer]OMC63174.1 hypothetical protein BK121_28895 [Paenibacillus odorifer]OMC74061.1 hypothetical protein BK125_22065 [Paenibacillus odorifer]OMD10942.1 hypothetical protein BSO21_28810 [Paenibacillus odorifer]OMD11777.1 hypothetical protein BJP47_25845 [Paenibacillus odorifer]OMD67440.1 hypothetical protein BSK48_20310 [Paenibacillus odorifer]
MELLVKNKEGNLWDISGIVSDISWKTARSGKPSTLELTLVDSGIYQLPKFGISNGDIIQFSKDNVDVFYGFVFSIDTGSDQEIKLTAYDQIRYLLGNGSYVLQDVTASDVIKKITTDYGLKTGVLEETEYRIPSLIEDDKKLLDIIMGAIGSELQYKGRLMAFYDDFGKLTLRKPDSMLLNLVLGAGHYLYDYSLKKSIDDDTYNTIFLYKDNEASGKRDFYPVSDKDNVKRWGILHLYQKADDKANAAQIQEKANNLLKMHNREKLSLSVQAIGDMRVRAGNFIYVLLDEFETQLFLVDQCSHKISGGEHTMSLDIKVV